MKNKFIALLTIILLAISSVAFAEECPLCDAAEEGDLSEVITILLGDRAALNHKDKDGWTALMKAAGNGHSKIAKILLDNGANINDRNKDGETALIAAALKGQSEVAKLLLDNGADVNHKDEEDDTALMGAASVGSIKVVKLLLDNGANVNDTDVWGDTALMWAANVGSIKVVKLLLDNGANVNNQGRYSRTALMFAVEEHSEVAKTLLDNGANVNAADQDGFTALMVAVSNNQSEIVKLLLDNGANVNAANTLSGSTAFMWATHVGNIKVVKLLLENGANVNDKDENGRTALISSARNTREVAKVSFELAKVLLDNGANVNDKDKDGKTALMYAVGNGKRKIAKVLLENGANVNDRNKNGDTVLMLAARDGQNEVAKVLLENGANVNYKNKNGYMALTFAAYNGESEVAKLLLECGANPDIRDKDGDNAWDLAKDKPIVYAILKKHLNDVVNGRKFPPCDKVATNKQNPTQPDVVGGIEADKLPKEHNIAERVFENTWRSVVYVDTYDSQGSGVIIRPNVIATNCHVVESANNIQIYKAEERRTNRDVSYNATIIKQDEENDFCLLSVEGLWGVAATIRKYNTLNIGEDVYGLGAPQGLDLSLSTGVVSQLRKEDGARLIQTDTAISPGSSGGGLFDSEGNLIGILTKKIVDDDVEGIGFAIPADLAL